MSATCKNSLSIINMASCGGIISTCHLWNPPCPRLVKRQPTPTCPPSAGKLDSTILTQNLFTIGTVVGRIFQIVNAEGDETASQPTANKQKSKTEQPDQQACSIAYCSHHLSTTMRTGDRHRYTSIMCWVNHHWLRHHHCSLTLLRVTIGRIWLLWISCLRVSCLRISCLTTILMMRIRRHRWIGPATWRIWRIRWGWIHLGFLIVWWWILHSDQ